MKYVVEKGEKSTVKISITLNAKEWDEAQVLAYNKTKHKYQVQGFRKGHVPKAVIEQFYGVGVFFEDAINEAFSKYYFDVLDKETEIEPIDRPDVAIDKIDEKGLKMTATVPVKPEVTIGAYNKITVDVKISSQEGNVLKIVDTSGKEGLYVSAPTGENAIVVANKSDTETQDKVVKLLIDNTANKVNVILTQTQEGLKANIDLSEYAKTADLKYVDDTRTKKVKAANSELAITNITQNDFTLTEELAEFVTADILKNGSVENGGGLVDHAKVYAEQITWVAAEDGKSAKREVVPTTLDQILALATAETVTVGEGEDVISFRTGHAGLMTPEEKFKLEKLVIDEDGSVGISGTVSAENVIGLPELIEDAVTVKDVKINGTSIVNPTNETADIPIATTVALGVVKSSAENTANKVTVEASGTMKVTKITTDILENGTVELVLNGGNASLVRT
jgi:hypothetical protein